MGKSIILIYQKPIWENGVLDINIVVVKIIHRERCLSMFWRTNHSLRYWILLSMEHDKHLRHQLLQNYRSFSYFIIKCYCLPFNDVLLRSNLQTGYLSYRNYPSHNSNDCLNNSIFSDSLYCLLYDRDLGISCTFWYYIRIDHRNGLYDTY